MPVYTLHQSIKIPTTLEKVWDFISAPGNLKKITPPYMGFDITTIGLASKMYAGMIIHYKVSPVLGIKTTWVTEITQVKDLKYFVDEQRVGHIGCGTTSILLKKLREVS
jgi:ligand-binding SRPBCC domain-containing protein